MILQRKMKFHLVVNDTHFYHTDKEEYLDDTLKAIGHILISHNEFISADKITIEITPSDPAIRDDTLALMEW